MSITISREEFNAAVQSAAVVSKKDGYAPAMAMAFISSDETGLTVKATDLDNWLSLTVPASGPPIAPIQVDAAKLADLVGKMTGDDIKLDVKDGALLLSSGKGSKRKLAGVVTTYPELPAVGGEISKVDIEGFREAVGFALPNVAGDDKPTFQGVRIQDGNAVAFNGAGFVAAAVVYAGAGFTLAPGTIRLLKFVPADAGLVELEVGERLMSVTWDGGSIAAKVMEGDWPFLRGGVDALLASHDHALSVHPSTLMAAVGAVKAVAADDKTSNSKRVTLGLSAKGVEVSVASQSGSASEPLDAEWDGDDLTVNLSAARLEGILRGFAADMPVAIGISPLGGDGEKVKGCVFRQDARPGFVGMLAQIR